MERKGLTKGGNGSPISNQEGYREDDDQDGEQGNCDDGQAYADINEECILDFNDDQFDALVDNVEEMIHNVRGEDEMTEVELRKYKQFVEDSKKPLYPHCEKYSRVTGDLKLLQLKAAHVGQTRVSKHCFFS